MESATAAPAPRGAALLHFYRDTLDRLALWRLTERDPAMQDDLAEVADDLLTRCAVLTRKMRLSCAFPDSGKIPGLLPVRGRADNAVTEAQDNAR